MEEEEVEESGVKGVRRRGKAPGGAVFILGRMKRLVGFP